MNTKDSSVMPAAASVAAPAPMPAANDSPRTKAQMKASAIAEGIALRAKWKGLIGEARTVWDKIHFEELVKVDGNFHRLAGLVQLRYQLSREESDRQVRTFFDKHALVA